MRRLAQFVRLRASRVCLASRVSHLSACICLACVSRLRAFVSRASRVCLASRVRLASVCVCSRQGFRMRASCASACICLACVSRLSASVSRLASRVCLASVSRLSRVCLASVVLSRVCLASVVLSRVCLASVVLSRVCLSPCECLRGLAHFMSVVIQRVQKVFAIVILSYNVPMPKYPSHHLIYVFYHPMPIMPLY